MRAIDADKMKADLLTVDPQFETMIDWCIRVLDAQPTIEPERKKGKWIMKYKGAVTSYKCSECGRTVKDDTGYDVSKDYPFCHCGADMREDQDGKSD